MNQRCVDHVIKVNHLSAQFVRSGQRLNRHLDSLGDQLLVVLLWVAVGVVQALLHVEMVHDLPACLLRYRLHDAMRPLLHHRDKLLHEEFDFLGDLEFRYQSIELVVANALTTSAIRTLRLYVGCGFPPCSESEAMKGSDLESATLVLESLRLRRLDFGL